MTIILLAFVYFFAIGAREYFTFFIKERRTNPLIYLDKEKDISKGLLGYHVWRLIEYGIVILICIKSFGLVGFLICVWGNYLVYERVWDFLKFGKIYKNQIVKYWVNGYLIKWDNRWELVFGFAALIMTFIVRG